MVGSHLITDLQVLYQFSEVKQACNVTNKGLFHSCQILTK